MKTAHDPKEVEWDTVIDNPDCKMLVARIGTTVMIRSFEYDENGDVIHMQHAFVPAKALMAEDQLREIAEKANRLRKIVTPGRPQ